MKINSNSERLSEKRQTNAYPQQYPYNTGMYPGYNPAVQSPTQPPFGFPPQSIGSMIPGQSAPGPGFGMPGGMPGMTPPSPPGQMSGMLPLERSYIENILRLNRGKRGTFYFTFENNNEWNAKVINGVVEAAGRDHLIISDPDTGERFVMLMVNFDYATFNEPLDYDYPFGATPPNPIAPR